MNPVLLKPGTDRRSFVVVRGEPAGTLEAGQYAAGRAHLADAAFAAYRELADAYELVVCEGAGSPAEINLRSGDYVNMGLAREFGLPVVVVGDIDRGGILASLYGTWALLDEDDRALLKSFVINKFRGDVSVLEPGLEAITDRTGVPFHGVIPWLLDVWLDSEDTLEVGHWRASTALSATSRDRLKVAVIRLPRISNATDVDALAAEPGVDVLVTIDPAVAESADLLVLPGSRSTASDLAVAARTRPRRGRRPPGGDRSSGPRRLRWLPDARARDRGRRRGTGRASCRASGHLPVRVEFGESKVLARPVGSWSGHAVDTRLRDPPRHRPTLPRTAPATTRIRLQRKASSTAGTSAPSGGRCGTAPSRATTSAGRGSRRSHARPGPSGGPHAGAPGFAERRERMLDTLADALEEHVDIDALLSLPFTRGGSHAMIERIRVIGIGMGDPGHVTGEAARALATVDVFLVADRATRTSDLVAARQAVCDALIPADHAYRVVEVTDPRRRPDAERDDTAYDRGVRTGTRPRRRVRRRHRRAGRR